MELKPGLPIYIVVYAMVSIAVFISVAAVREKPNIEENGANMFLMLVQRVIRVDTGSDVFVTCTP